MTGIVALIALALAYRTEDGQPLVLGPLFVPGDTVWLRHSWWGILGLIGWAYLVASLIYLAFGRRREWLIGATAMLALLYVAEQKGPVLPRRFQGLAGVGGAVRYGRSRAYSSG